MPNTSPRLNLPYILQSQAQKEVTHNNALNLLDALTRPVIKSINVNTPPGTPTAGDCHIVGSSPTGAFSGQTNKLAYYSGNGWVFSTPFKWLDVVNEEDDTRYIFNGTAWVQFGLLMRDAGDFLRISHMEEETILSGATTSSTITIPNRAIVMAVNCRVTQAITGATSFSIGISGDATRYGNSLGIALDTTNIGMTQHPFTYYANTALLFTANGGSFTAGKVRVGVQYFESRGAWSW
jgi:hypothetical protein